MWRHDCRRLNCFYICKFSNQSNEQYEKMKIILLPRPIEGTRYTKTKPYLPLDICLKPFVQLNDGVSVVGPFLGSEEAHAWMLEEARNEN